MEIVLLSDYPQLGFTGERVEVKPGFARNKLIPTGIAVEVNKRNEKFLKNKFQAIESRKAKLKEEAESKAEAVIANKLKFKLKSAEAGKSFGSVGAKEVVAELKAKGFDFNKNQITLDQVIKKTGDYIFKLKLHSDVIIEVPFHVEVEVSKKKKVAAVKAEDEASQADSNESEENDGVVEEGSSSDEAENEE